MKLRRFAQRRWLAAMLLGLLVSSAVAVGQFALSASIEIAREHWSRMPQDEREEIAVRYRDFQTLDDQERRALYRRARRLSGLQEELVLSLPEGARLRLERLEPEKRRRVLRDMLEDELRDRGLRVHGTLPTELARDLEHAPPSERRRLLRDFDRGGRRLRLENLARELGIDEAELGDLSRLDDDELDARLHELRRRVIERAVEERGLPRWLSVDEWSELRAVDDATFTRRWRLALSRRGATEANPFEQLMRSLRPDPSWHVENAHMSSEERRVAVYRMAKKRALDLMDRLAMDPGEIERMNRLDGPDLMAAMRDFARRYRPEPR